MIHNRLRNGVEKRLSTRMIPDTIIVVKCKFGDIPFDRARVRPFAVANSARHIYVKQEVDNANSYKTRS